MGEQRFIPGVGPVFFPDGMSEEEMAAAAAQLMQGTPSQPAPTLDANQQINQQLAAARQTGNEVLRGVDKASIPKMAGRRMADNLLNLPEATGDMLAGGAALAQTAAGTVPQFFDGEDMSAGDGLRSFRDRFDQNFNQQRQQFPASALRSVDLPDTFDIQAGVQTGLDKVTGTAEQPMAEQFAQNRDELVEGNLQMREQNPGSAAFGDVFGDAGSLALMRRPGAVGRRNRSIASRQEEIRRSFDAPKEKFEFPTIEKWPQNIKNSVDDAVNSDIADALKRGGLRVGEAGIEGALLAAMNDADPLSSVALAAGQQAVGSTLLTLGQGIIGGKGRNAAVAAAGLLAYYQMFKEVTPGGRDRILESSEAVFAKLGGLAALGGVAALAGSGRITSGKQFDRFPWVADGITALPRGSVQSFLRELSQRDDEEYIMSIFRRLGSDPDYFGTTARRRLERAAYNPDVSPIKVIDNLRGDPQFRRAVARMNEGQQ